MMVKLKAEEIKMIRSVLAEAALTKAKALGLDTPNGLVEANLCTLIDAALGKAAARKSGGS
jgi:hypothetical protein